MRRWRRGEARWAGEHRYRMAQPSQFAVKKNATRRPGLPNGGCPVTRASATRNVSRRGPGTAGRAHEWSNRIGAGRHVSVKRCRRQAGEVKLARIACTGAGRRSEPGRPPSSNSREWSAAQYNRTAPDRRPQGRRRRRGWPACLPGPTLGTQDRKSADATSSPWPPSMKSKERAVDQPRAAVGDSPTIRTTWLSRPACWTVRRAHGNVSINPVRPGRRPPGHDRASPGWISSEPRWWSTLNSTAPWRAPRPQGTRPICRSTYRSRAGDRGRCDRRLDPGHVKRHALVVRHKPFGRTGATASQAGSCSFNCRDEPTGVCAGALATGAGVALENRRRRHRDGRDAVGC